MANSTSHLEMSVCSKHICTSKQQVARASGQETWLAQYVFRYFCVPSHLKTVKLTEVPVVCIEVLSTVVI